MNYLLFLAVFPSSYLVLYRLCKSTFIPFRFNPQYPSQKLLLRESGRCLTSVLICCTYDAIVSHLNSKHLLPYQQHQDAAGASTAPDTSQCVLYMLVIFAWSDTHFYWTHRMLHDVPWLYRHVHKLHHESYNPDPMSGLSFHPAEAMLYFTSVLLVCVAPIPYWAYRIHMIAVLLAPANGHNGHAQGSMDLTGVTHHYLHHTKFAYNFGSPTPFWDILCGTEYRENDTRSTDTSSERAKAAAVQAAEAGGRSGNNKGKMQQ